VTTELRVAYLTSAFARSGDTFIRNEVNELRRLGVTVDTYSIRRPPVEPGADGDVARHQATTEYVLEAGLGLFLRAARSALRHPLRFACAIGLAWRTSAPGLRGLLWQMAYVIEAGYLADCLVARGTQILHNHIGENSATVAMLAAEMSGMPFTLTIHGPYIFFAPQRWALSEKLARAAFTACISHYCRSQCLLFAPEQAWTKLQIVRCSVQPLFVENPPPRTLRAKTHFVCVGRLCVEKGQRFLIEAARAVIAADPSARFTIIGDGPDRAKLERAIQENHLPNNVAILGWRSSAAVREMLVDATALVIASLAEGLPVVAMEALASGCPVIATNIAAAAELIEPGRNGWLIPAGSVEALVAAMQAAAKCDAESLAQMGAAGRERVLELHHPVRQSELLLTHLRAAAASR
jgi:colanic acid/amylovoran biosynthesis glycosyltransferase